MLLAYFFWRAPALKRHAVGYHFWHVHSIVFDQLIHDVANFCKRGEVRALVDGLPLKDVRVEAPPMGLDTASDKAMSENAGFEVRRFFRRWLKFYYFIATVFGPLMFTGLSSERLLARCA